MLYKEFIYYKDFTLISESLSSARKLFVTDNNLISNDVFIKLTNIDPSKTKKYLDAICSYYLEDISVEVIEEYIQLFDTLTTKNIIKQKDINKYKNFHDLQIEVTKSKDIQTKSEIKNIKKQDAEIILDNSDLLIVVPKSHDSSCIYGAGTQWCTTMKDSHNWQRYYRDLNVTFYYIYNKKANPSNNMYKVAVAVYPNNKIECYNAWDEDISFQSVLSTFNLKEDLFKPKEKNFLEKIINGTYNIDSQGFYNVTGDVDLSKQNLSEIPIKFGIISGHFSCYNNKLTTLKNSPYKVGKNFDCSYNQLISLKDSPKEVGRNFSCSFNKLTSLEGCPEYVNGSFYCSNNNIKILKYLQNEIHGNFDCSFNKLTSLEGCPEKVHGNFYCSNNKLKTLNFIPQSAYVDVSYNQLKTLKNLKIKFQYFSNEHVVICNNNTKLFTIKYIKSIIDPHGIYKDRKLTIKNR